MKRMILLTAMILTFACATGAWAQDEIQFRAGLDRESVQVGEPFTFIIQVEGTDEAPKVDVAAIPTVRFHGENGGPSNSSFIQSINGQVTRRITRHYQYQAQLTATRSGTLSIPPVPFTVAGQTFQTQPMKIEVTEPKTSENFQLHTELDATGGYVGQPMEMNITLLIGADHQGLDVDFPILRNPDFRVASLPVDHLTHRASKTQQAEIEGLKTDLVLDIAKANGKRFQRYRFRWLVTPLQAGAQTLGAASATTQLVVGYKQDRARDPMMDPFFDDPFFRNSPGMRMMQQMRRRPIVERVIARSDPVSLDIKPLPTAGRPADFSGLIGQITVAALAEPIHVKVGDPITLKVIVAGTPDLDGVELPPLRSIPALAQNFRIPREPAIGKIDGKAKVYTQTIRAKHAGVEELPRIALPYFNTATGTYEIARTNPIPLQVEETQRVTAKDLVGVEAEEPPAQAERRESTGLAPNRHGDGLLVDQRIHLSAWREAPGWLLVLVIPPGVFLALLGVALVRRVRIGDDARLRARTAYGALSRAVEAHPDSADALLQAWRVYLTDRTGSPSRSLTSREARQALQARGLGAETTQAAVSLFDTLEAHRYGGGGGERAALAKRMLDVAREMERRVEA